MAWPDAARKAGGSQWKACLEGSYEPQQAGTAARCGAVKGIVRLLCECQLLGRDGAFIVVPGLDRSCVRLRTACEKGAEKRG